MYLLNIQTEHQENHIARITVEIDAERLEAAKQKAARGLSNRLNIPGFRKGKAPYRIVVKYVGEGAIIEEAVDSLGETIYKEALPETGLEPYGPGSLDDIKLDDLTKPTFVYTVPLAPEVDLGDYRAVRLDFTEATVTDKDVERSLRGLQEQTGVAEDSENAAAENNRVTLDIHSFFVEEHEEAGEDEEHDHDHEGHDHSHGEHFIYENDFVTLLSEDYEPVKGFNAEIVGMNAGDKKDFELTFADDVEDEELRGRKVKFEVTLKKVENFTLPALDDELAAIITKDEEKQLTLEELRARTRENLEEAKQRTAKSEYASKVLDKVIEGATLKFPEAMVTDEIERTLQRFDQQLRQQNRMTLDDYLKISQSTVEQLHPQFRPQALLSVERALTMRQLLEDENIELSEEAVDAEIDKILEVYDVEQREALRGLFTSGGMRDNIKDDVLTQRLMDRLAAIGKGEADATTEVAEKPAKAAKKSKAKAEKAEDDAEVTDSTVPTSGDETEDKGE